MKNLTNIERLNKTTSTSMEIVEELAVMKDSGIIDIDHVLALVQSLTKDQLELIDMVNKYERLNNVIERVEIPSFI